MNYSPHSNLQNQVPPNISVGRPPQAMDSSFPKCSQCGYYHPPIPYGQRCEAAPTTTDDGQIINFEKFFLNLKNILTTHMSKNKITDPGKLLNSITIQIMKMIEHGEIK